MWFVQHCGGGRQSFGEGLGRAGEANELTDLVPNQPCEAVPLLFFSLGSRATFTAVGVAS